MKKCEKCDKEFPTKMVVDGKARNLQRRKFCLDCSPFGEHNTADLIGETERLSSKERRKRSQNAYKSRNAEKVVEWRRRVKLKLIAYKGGKCEICGYSKDCSSCYDFHHKDPSEKEFGISSKTLSYTKLLKEVDKCVLLCRNCHGELHDIEYRQRQQDTIKLLQTFTRD